MSKSYIYKNDIVRCKVYILLSYHGRKVGNCWLHWAQGCSSRVLQDIQPRVHYRPPPVVVWHGSPQHGRAAASGGHFPRKGLAREILTISMSLPILSWIVFQVWERTLYGPWYFRWRGGLTESTWTYTQCRSGLGVEGEVSCWDWTGMPVWSLENALSNSCPSNTGTSRMDPGSVQGVPYNICAGERLS